MLYISRTVYMGRIILESMVSRVPTSGEVVKEDGIL